MRIFLRSSHVFYGKSWSLRISSLGELGFCCQIVLVIWTLIVNGNFLSIQTSQRLQGTANAVRIQVENGVFTGNARATNVHPGYDGIGFIGYMMTTGSEVTLQTNVSSGSYTLQK